MTKRTKAQITLLAVLLPILAAVWLTPQIKDKGPISAQGGERLSITLTPLPPYFLQTDERWKNEKIGGSGESIASIGCTLCCVSMSLSQNGYEIDPGTLNYKMVSVQGYTDQGWLKWNRISRALGRKTEVSVPSRPTHKAIDHTLRDNQPVIAKIMLNEAIPHWVLIVGKNGREYVVMDPLNREKTLVPLSTLSKTIHSIRMVALNRSEFILLGDCCPRTGFQSTP
ncbi:MAG: hypothetical protein JXR40_07790 [Pontiellaceae bacterium]|nr:hypothetical protein [Pontiellaceae bacterium]